MTAARASAALGAVAALLGGGCALSVEGELPDVQITRHAVVVPGAPAEARLGEPTASVAISVNPRDHVDLDPSSYRSVRVRELVFSATNADLSFVHGLQLFMSGAHGAAPIQVLDYQHAADAPAVGGTLAIPVDPPVEVVSAWRDAPATLTLQMHGPLPDEGWTVDVPVHLSATIGY